MINASFLLHFTIYFNYSVFNYVPVITIHIIIHELNGNDSNNIDFISGDEDEARETTFTAGT